jgi:molybdopterin converting factor small subunit
MSDVTRGEVVLVRMFGMLREVRREQGLPASAEVRVPANGVSAGEIALDLGLQLELIEGVFCNHVIRPLTHTVRPGDEIAFVPYGTPGPHRFFLGLYDAGRGEG